LRPLDLHRDIVVAELQHNPVQGVADTVTLAVTDARGQVALLLDEALTQLDFTDAERAALRAARAGFAARAA